MFVNYLLSAMLLITHLCRAEDTYIVGISEPSIRIATPQELELAFNQQLKLASKNSGITPIIKVVPDNKALLSHIRNKEFDGYYGSPIFFLHQEKLFTENILYSVIVNNEVKHHFVILVRKDSGIKKLEDLKKSKLAFCKADDIGLLNLAFLLKNKNLEKIPSFFSKLIIKNNPSLAISSVFFKESNATIVMESDLEIAAELNPQIKEQLIAIHTSPEYITNVIALSTQRASNIENQLFEIINGTNKKNIDTFRSYRFTQVIKINKSDLKSVQDLMNQTKDVQESM